MEELKRRTVFERDYTAGLEHLDAELTPENKQLICAALKRQEALDNIPYAVNELESIRFDSMTTTCDQIAKEFCGRLAATVDYQSHEAVIKLECVYLDFDTSEFMAALREMATTALQVRFEPLTSGFLRLTLIMPYFSPFERRCYL